MVVDNQLVNAECRPVGGMAAAPLVVTNVMRGATISMTLDCNNTFNSLVVAENDRAYTAISPPGMPRLELTRMPMVSTLVWVDDIIIYSRNMEEHIKHVDDVQERRLKSTSAMDENESKQRESGRTRQDENTNRHQSAEVSTTHSTAEQDKQCSADHGK